MQGEIVSILNKVIDIQEIVPNTSQLCIISNSAEGNQMISKVPVTLRARNQILKSEYKE